jgi:pimeloyl-ACP methyl ester carboxylesterase
VAVLLALEDSLVYMATPASSSWSEPRDLVKEDVELHSADGTRLHAWWCPVKDSRGAVLFCHGQQGNLSHRAWLVPRLQRLGASVLIFDYPGFGRSEGSPSEAGCYAAADAAYDWLVDEQKVSPCEILIIGKSLGGGIACDLAARRPSRGLVLCMTFTSLPDVAQRLLPVVPASWLMRNRFNNLDKIGQCKGPVFIAHGTRDFKIPPSQAERLFEAAPGPKRYFAMEGLGHSRPCFTDECLDEIRSFLHEIEATATRKRSTEQ